METIEISISNKLNAIIDEVFYAVADQKLSQESLVVKALAEAKRILSIPNLTNGEEIYNYSKYKWTHHGMLEHCLRVVELMLNNKNSFPMACRIRAKEVHKTIPSIRQACCRANNLKSDVWHKMASGDNSSKDSIMAKLISKYDTEKNRIIEVFQVKYLK